MGPKTLKFLAAGGDHSPFLRALSGRRILGVNPPVFDFAWFDLWSKPVGLLSLMGWLRSRGNRVELIDCLYEARTAPRTFGRWKVAREPLRKPGPLAHIPRRYWRFGLGEEAFRRRLADVEPPDLVLVTGAMTYWYPGVRSVIRALKEAFPSVPLLLGGAYARLCPEHALSSGADLVQTEPLPLSLGGPAMDLYDRPEYGVLITSWGCPMHCSYCAARVLWGAFRERPMEEVLKDLGEQMGLLSMTDLAFYDDALLVNPERRFYPLCAHIRGHFPKLRLHTPNGLHVARLDERCCSELFETGFRTIRLSLEGVDAYTRGQSAEKAGARDYERAVCNLLRAGYVEEDIETYILVGLPGQDLRDVERAVDFVLALGGYPKLAEFSPIPGSLLFGEALRLTPEIGKEPLLQNNTLYAPYVARTMAPESLQSLRDRARRRSPDGMEDG